MSKRLTLAAGAAAIALLALLALPSLASARPGATPELVQRSGRLVVLHSDHGDGTATQRWLLVNGSARLTIHAPEVWIDPGARERLEGTIQHGELVLADSLTAVTQLSAAPAVAPEAQAPVLDTTAVILLGFSGAGPTTASLPASGVVGAALASLNAYYQEQSYGQLGFDTTVLGPVTIAGDAALCGGGDPEGPLYAWLKAAEAQLPGFAEPGYRHIVLAFPSVASCGLAGVSGIAEIGGAHVWINGEFSLRALAHELGHNLGLKHAGGLACTTAGTPSPTSDHCTQNQYGDPFDAMGKAPVVRQMSMEHKLALHLLPASAVKVVGANGTYRLAPMETLTPGAPGVLRIPRQGGGSYFVEYRQPSGSFDSQPPALSGVLIRTELPDSLASGDPANDPDTVLVDLHPATVGDWSDAALDLGQVFSDPLSGVTIQDVAQDAAGATLQLTVPLDTVPPTAPSGLSAVANGTSVTLGWGPASDDYAVDYYRVIRDGAQVGAPPAPGFTDTGLIPGATASYSVVAVDAGGNAGPAVSASVRIPDTTPPGAPVKVKAKLGKDGKVRLSWGAASDDGRIASYRVLRNGTPIASGNDDSYVDRAPKVASNRPTVTYSVTATDLAGNVGPAGTAAPLRSALLRKLGARGLEIMRVKVGAHALLRVKGTLSDAKARCRLRVGKGAWHACGAKGSGAFRVSLPARGASRVTLSLRDAIGRVTRQTLRIP